MALTEPSANAKVLEFVGLETKVILARACKRNDVLGVAEDNFDDMGPAYSDVSAHATGITYLPRFIAGQDGAANDEIVAYGSATLSGYSSAAKYSKVYMAATSGVAGQITETAPTTTGACANIIGTSVATNRVSLFPFGGSPADTIAS